MQVVVLSSAKDDLRDGYFSTSGREALISAITSLLRCRATWRRCPFMRESITKSSDYIALCRGDSLIQSITTSRKARPVFMACLTTAVIRVGL